MLRRCKKRVALRATRFDSDRPWERRTVKLPVEEPEGNTNPAVTVSYITRIVAGDCSREGKPLARRFGDPAVLVLLALPENIPFPRGS